MAWLVGRCALFLALREVLLGRNARRLVIFVDEPMLRSPLGRTSSRGSARDLQRAKRRRLLNRIAFCLLGSARAS
jgi:hypothetical protein